MAELDGIAIKPFAALTLTELHACLKLRGEVFVVSQRICEVPDVDEYDPACHHVMLWREGELVGTARFMTLGSPAVIKLGRVAVSEAHQRKGLGTTLMRGVQDWITAQPGRQGVMHAQQHLESWYTTLGWRREGGPFSEAGIEHVKMRYSSENGA